MSENKANNFHQILLDFEQDFNNFTDCQYSNSDDQMGSEYMDMTLNEMTEKFYNFPGGEPLYKDFAEYMADILNMDGWVEDWTRENLKEIANKTFREVYTGNMK
jgi:hypothetical protein